MSVSGQTNKRDWMRIVEFGGAVIAILVVFIGGFTFLGRFDQRIKQIEDDRAQTQQKVDEGLKALATAQSEYAALSQSLQSLQQSLLQQQQSISTTLTTNDFHEVTLQGYTVTVLNCTSSIEADKMVCVFRIKNETNQDSLLTIPWEGLRAIVETTRLDNYQINLGTETRKANEVKFPVEYSIPAEQVVIGELHFQAVNPAVEKLTISQPLFCKFSNVPQHARCPAAGQLVRDR